MNNKYNCKDLIKISIGFGNPNNPEIQNQPYITIAYSVKKDQIDKLAKQIKGEKS